MLREGVVVAGDRIPSGGVGVVDGCRYSGAHEASLSSQMMP